ncbi:MAG: inositol monophosphatase family protein [Thermoprotei archaeon]|nr:inositol monophosphatase family protein [Thermoprotei archaeon]
MGAAYDYEDLRRIAVRVAGEAAGLLRDHACDSRYTRKVKGETIVADKISEDYILDALRGENLKVRGISEEKGPFGDEGIFVAIDPLDGSTNYTSCISWASVSIAFALNNTMESLVAGAVAPVFYGNTFSFSKGGGCYYGGRRLARPKTVSRLVFAYVEDAVKAQKLIDAVKHIEPEVKIRGLGSAALEICYVAAGRAILFADLRGRLRNIDIAAAVGFLRECGGEAYDSKSAILNSSLENIEVVGDVVASLDKNVALEFLKLIGTT